MSGNILKPFGGQCGEEDDQVLDESLQHSRGNNETDEIAEIQGVDINYLSYKSGLLPIEISNILPDMQEEFVQKATASVGVKILTKTCHRNL